MGPGLLESTYQKCIEYEFSSKGIHYVSENPLPVKYKGVELECGYRIDFLIESKVILELKAVTEMNPIYHAQLLTYMKLANVKRGLLMNF